MHSTINTRFPLALATATLLTCLWGASPESVKFQDLNVNTPEGVQALYGRIHAAAKRVCSESDRGLQAAASACARKAEADTIESLNLSQLTAYYEIKTGEHTQLLVAAR